MDKGTGITSSKVDGCDVDCVEGFSSCDIRIPPCMDMELYFGEEPLQLSSCPPDANEKLLGAGSESSARVLQKVKEIRRHVRLSCEGFEEELMALLTAIEASHSQKESAL